MSAATTTAWLDAVLDTGVRTYDLGRPLYRGVPQHIDAFSHVSHDGVLFGGVDAADAQRGGKMNQLGAETIEPMFRHGVLLDVPATLGLPACEPGYEITPADLDRTVERQGTDPRPGDVALVRSGWGSRSTHEFLFVLSSLKLVGATGSPVRPLAVVAGEGR